jgi:A/G-specific adenine glycosylase
VSRRIDKSAKAALPDRQTSSALKVRALVTALLAWFAENARDLPWRRTRDPYAIWVSEIMLQQTQVKTVIPYWERWLRALPTVESLAKARPETIHKLWEGLGYYTRVRNMQRAAQKIVAEHGGKFPRDHDAILELPGIGRYTAGAIASIAFNEPRAILDGNVIRVLTRIFGITENAREKPVNEKLWRLAGELVIAASGQRDTTAKRTAIPSPFPLPIGWGEGGRRPGEGFHQHQPDFGNQSSLESCSHLNQSLMELGALICTPRQPKCALCPVQKHCVAFKTGRVEAIPNLGPRTSATARRFVAFVIERNGRFLARQRPAGVVNAHLWEFPNVEIDGDGFDLKKITKQELGIAPDKLRKFCTIKHSITRYRITLEAYGGKMADKKTRRGPVGKWLTKNELAALAFASAHRKILERLTKEKAGDSHAGL